MKPFLKIEKMWKNRFTNPNMIISFSIFNDLPFYTEGAIINAKLAKWVYPGWTVRVYLDKTVPKTVVDRLLDEGAQVYKVTTNKMKGGERAMWRFLVAGESVRFICRDADSRLNVKEAWVVNEWINSGKQFHRIWDNSDIEFGHSNPLLAGMWGGTAKIIKKKNLNGIPDSVKERNKADPKFFGQILQPAIPGIKKLLLNWNEVGYRADENFLKKKILPKVEKNIISFGQGIPPVHGKFIPFELQNKFYEEERPHIGEPIQLNDSRNKEENWKESWFKMKKIKRSNGNS